MITTSTPARWQASSARAWAQREVALGVAEERAARAEQGAVEVGVDAAAGAIGPSLTLAGGEQLAPRRPHARLRRRRSRPGSSTSPTTRSSRARAAARPSGRSPTAWRWSRPGFDLLDVGARRRPAAARRSRGRGEAARAGPGDRGRWRRGAGRAGRSPTPSRPRSRGARARRRGRGDQRHLRRLGRDARAGRRARLRLRADAHRGPAAGRPPAARVRRRRRPPRSAWFAERIERGRGARRRRGADRDRPRARLRPQHATTTSRSCAGSASCARSGARCSSRSRARTSSAPSLAGSWEERLRRRASASGRRWRRPRSPSPPGAEILRLHDVERARRDAGRGRDRRGARVSGARSTLRLLAWERLLEPGEVDGRLVADERRAERASAAARVPIPGRSRPTSSRRCCARGITGLYSHQLEALEAAAARRT